MEDRLSILLALLRRMLANLIRFGWIDSLASVFRDSRALLIGALPRCDLPSRAGRVSDARCVPIRREEMKQPDPLIYDQYFLMKLGLAVTWDNPDIWLERNGVPVPSSAIESDSEYDIVARVWNGSTEAPVASLPVRFSYLSFGIGTTSTPIPGAVVVSLGVKGGPNAPAFARKRWRTPRTPGHYCLQALLDWADDANPNNNLGQENLLIGDAHSPARFTFALCNNATERRRFRFETDAYTIPEPPACPERAGGDRALRARLEAHRREAHPLPSGWHVEFEPSEPLLAPNEQIEVAVTVAPPDGFHGAQLINANAFDDRQSFRGGVTLQVVGG